MNHNAIEYQIEKPRKAGNEAEFELQRCSQNAVTCKAHMHNTLELLYVKEGKYRAILDGDEYEIEKGDLILFCSNTLHHVFSLEMPNNAYYVIKLPPSFFLEFSKREIGAEYIMRFALNRKERKTVWRHDELEGSEILQIIEQLIKEYEEQKYASEIAIRLKIMELLLAILRESRYESEISNTQTIEAIYKIMRYVRSNYASDMDEKNLAHSIGMSYSYFSRSFKKVSGMTFRQFLNLTRVRRADQMMCDGDKSITEIAAMCGYNNTSYFIKTYRSITGKTPYQVLRRR